MSDENYSVFEEIAAIQDMILEEQAAECPEAFDWELTITGDDDGLCAPAASASCLYDTKEQAERDKPRWIAKGLKVKIHPVHK